MLLLGVSWLVLAPLSLWLLVRGRGSARAGAVLALAGLEAATVWVSGGGPRTIGPRDTVAAAAAGHAIAPAEPSPAVVRHRAWTAGHAATHPGATGPTPSAVPCAARPVVPERAALVRRAGEPRALRLFWPASPDECRTATVLLRREGREVRIWLHEGDEGAEGTMEHRPARARTVPVTVSDGVASVRTRLTPPPVRGRLRTVDGRSGLLITLDRA
ncbi:hypothetical protein [Streptosporangium pseudovulgare]|uniref:Integral membrane protein n=1 Tax=Streptosporangium pseudovulgare TaxID=35765 RepID=A0ABQ2QNZ6_9ACTN|nr:hypothetical protein [Streptosporangium pseudovulgare]GGP88635.1 hypothetical protein GCM10010140_17950 [Streptosporangium pseudovulgare]